MEWIEVGPGAGRGEIIRAAAVPGGVLVATVYQRKTYGPVRTRNQEIIDTLVIADEVTRALSFVSGAHLEDLLPHRSERDSVQDEVSEKASRGLSQAALDASVSR